ncbi:hypothetical protein Vadar_013772 [Vaccinium darrowii]|uniref:Uncharacterized protein n=1 Tax=Vaccinium darrowii TaxID=229202 RepID=A0ACB7X0F5_9ERIC|nr:hypothetical protein Vadar_013772 [Vaccinium darrowii]
MASLLSLPSLLFLLIIITSLLVQSSSSKPHRSVKPCRTPLPRGFRIPLTHVDHGRKLTKSQRVQRSIQRGKHRLETFYLMATTVPGSNTTTVPGGNIQAPVCAGNGEYLMELTIGSSAVPVSVIMDTGSDLIWTQCKPCTQCFQQPTPIFNPAQSRTFQKIPHTSGMCDCENTYVFNCNNGCQYTNVYGGQSSTRGYMAQDTFIFGDSTPVYNIGFGCGVNNQGLGLTQGSGIVGLGRGPLSLISQLGVDQFSYCLPPMGEDTNGTVFFGAQANLNYSTISANHSTPLIQNPYQPSLYYVSVQAITVGKILLPMSKNTLQLNSQGNGGMILDCGTTLTYLKAKAFNALKTAFISQMQLEVSESPQPGLDLCFDLPATGVSGVVVPKLMLHFVGGFNLVLPTQNYMISEPWNGVMCLSIVASGNGLSILGNMAQQNLLVLNNLEMETGTLNGLVTEEIRLEVQPGTKRVLISYHSSNGVAPQPTGNKRTVGWLY